MKEKIIPITGKIAPELQELSRNIYHRPELGFEEVFASASHTALLEKHGFQVERGVCGLETAFIGVYDTGRPGPVVGYMAEYDALPSIGHGCGHNILGAGGTGSAIALRYLMEKENLPGKVILFGTPAEETSGGKVTMVNNGLFDRVDAVMMAHPDTKYRLSATSLALEPVEFEFFGRPAHAAANPESGINALDAAIFLFNGINGLRQHVTDDVRIHGVIKEGGVAANIVPDYTRCEFYVRAATKKTVKEVMEKVLRIGEAAALATGCTMKHRQFEEAYDDMVTNETLNAAFKSSIRAFTDDPITEKEGGGGSIDAGNVSHVVPTIHGYFPITTEPLPGHTREFAEATLSAYAEEKLEEIVNILTLTGARVLTEPDLLREIKEEYANQLEEGRVLPPTKG